MAFAVTDTRWCMHEERLDHGEADKAEHPWLIGNRISAIGPFSPRLQYISGGPPIVTEHIARFPAKTPRSYHLPPPLMRPPDANTRSTQPLRIAASPNNQSGNCRMKASHQKSFSISASMSGANPSWAGALGSWACRR